MIKFDDPNFYSDIGTIPHDVFRWEVINTEPIVPKCNFCDRTTDQMARFHITRGHGETFYICDKCAIVVKDCIDKWSDPESKDHIEGQTFKYKNNYWNKSDSSYP